MPDIEMPDGTVIYGVPKGITKADLLGRLQRNGYDTARLLTPRQGKSALEEIPVVGGALSSIADIPLSAVQGLAGAGKTVSDLFGPDNAVSGVLGGIAEGAGRLKSTGSKEDAAISAAEQKSAEDKGILEQIKAAGRAFGRAPLETTASAVGSAVPFIAASVAGGLPAAAALGVASGVGMIKGDIYDAVQEELLKTGKVTPEQAAAIAEKAQEYGGENTDMQLLGGALGALAAATGLAPAVANRLGARAAAKVASQAAARQAASKAAPSLTRRIVTGAVAEAVPEAVQAGQERAAQNIALQREGFDVDPMKGVAGQAAFEGIASLIPGAAGKVYGTRGARPASAAPAVEEETSELDIPVTTGVDPEVTLARLSEAAGPTLSPAARTAVAALNRRVSNDLSLSTSESLDASRAFITAREDDIAAGKYPEDIAGPYANALAEARRMLEEVVPATTQAGVDGEAAQAQAKAGAGLDGGAGRPDVDVAGAAEPSVPTAGDATTAGEATQTASQAEPIGVASVGEPAGSAAGAETGADGTLTPETVAPTVDPLAAIKAAPNMVERKKVARPLVSNIVDELVGDVVIPGKVLTNITNVVSQEAAKPDAQFDLKTRVGELLTKNGVEVSVAAEPAYTYADLAAEADSLAAINPDLAQFAMDAKAVAAAAEQGMPVPSPVELRQRLYESTKREAPTPEPVATEPAPEPVAAEPVPPVPPTPPPTDAEPSAAAPEPTPSPARNELKTPNKWLVRLADRFGMSAPLDAFVKANLGYESLPEALETTSKLELSTSQRAGKERNLQRSFFDPVVDAAANLKVDLGDLGFFLWARSAADRNRVVAELNPEEFPEGGSGLTTAQAAEGLQRLKDEGKLPALNQLARKVDELVDFNLAEDVKAGLLSEKQAQQLRKSQPFYVPLKGFAKDGDMLTADIDEDANGPDRQQEAMQAMRAVAPTGSVQEFRKAFGRGSMPFHPLFNLFQDSETRVRRRLMNAALLPTLHAYMQNPSMFDGILNVYTDTNPKRIKVGRDIPGGRWEPVFSMQQEYYRNRDKYMMVKENGVPHYIEFAETGPGVELKRMFTNMRQEDLKGLVKVVANVNNFLKGMLTYKNPLYLLTVAPLRDTSAAITTALANQNIKTSPAYKKNLAAKTFFQVLNPSTGMTVARYVFGKAPMTDATGRLLQEMIDAGGTPLQSRFMNVQEKAGAAARAVKTMQGAGNLSPKDRAANLLSGLNRWVDGLADIMDMNARFATYRAATELGIKPTDAARLALDSSLNLTRRGEMARSLDLVLPFFGAGIEASRKTTRILTNPKALTKVFGSLIVLGVMESLWNAGQSDDNDDDGKEDYLDQDLGAGLRLSRLVIYHGSGPDDYIKVPIDPMLGYFKFIGNMIGDLMAGTTSPDEATSSVVTKAIPGFIRMMSPLRVPGLDVQSLTTAITPLVGKPFMENIFNENFFGSPIFTEAYPGGAPRSELGRASTGDFWKSLAKVVNEATGGSEAVSGKVDFQPEAYRHIIESYFGGPYQLAKQMAGLKEAEGIADVPGIKSFAGSGSEYAPQSKYFENTATVRQIMGRLSKLTPEQQARQGEKYFEDTDPRVMDAFKAVEANLDRINKEQKATLDMAATDEDKQLVLDYYRDQKNRYYSAFNYTYNAAKRGE